MSEKSKFPEPKDVQHHTSRAIGPVGNTAYNLDEINPNEIISALASSQDEEENSRLPASSQADYSVSKNNSELPFTVELSKPTRGKFSIQLYNAVSGGVVGFGLSLNIRLLGTI
jgi:hypothetical protein